MFDRRNEARGIRAASVHPRVIQTDLTRNLDPAEFGAAFQATSEQHVALGNRPFAPKSIPQGAVTSVWAGVVADADVIGGRYCEDCTVGNVLEDARADRGTLGTSVPREDARENKSYSVSPPNLDAKLNLRRFGGHPEARFELEVFDGSASSRVAGIKAAVLHGGV